MKGIGKKIGFLLLGLAGLFFILLFAELYSIERPFNWFKTYRKVYNDPYDCSLVFKRLEDVFPDKSIKSLSGNSEFIEEYESVRYLMETNDDDKYDEEIWNDDAFETEEEIIEEEVFQDSIFSVDFSILEEIETLKTEYDFPYQDKSNVIIVGEPNTNDAFIENLLLHVSAGNGLFIASENFDFLEDYIPLQTNNENDSLDLYVGSQKYTFIRGRNGVFFSGCEYPDKFVLARNSNNEPVLLKFPFGDGFIVLSSTPVAFTNYYLLKKETQPFIEFAFNQLENEDTYWSEKSLRMGVSHDESKLDYLKKQPPLWWAFNIALYTMIVFMLFALKRRQRLIPVLDLPENSTVEYIRIMAQLHIQNGNNKLLFHKKLNYFLEYIRKKYHLDTSILDGEFIDKLITVSQKDPNRVRFLFNLISDINTKSEVSKEELITVHKSIVKFKA